MYKHVYTEYKFKPYKNREGAIDSWIANNIKELINNNNYKIVDRVKIKRENIHLDISVSIVLYFANESDRMEFILKS